MNIRIATTEDLVFLSEHDRHIPPNRLEKQLQDGCGYVACDEQRNRLALLRFSYFWDTIPFINLLYVIESHRTRGIGRRLVERWEADMFRGGAELLLTSTQADEDAQHFYRKLGYRDCGVLLVPGQAAGEIFLRKQNLAHLGEAAQGSNV